MMDGMVTGRMPLGKEEEGNRNTSGDTLAQAANDAGLDA